MGVAVSPRGAYIRGVKRRIIDVNHGTPSSIVYHGQQKKKKKKKKI